jgi:deferrochelatase/peroxidase EfeB
MTSGGAPTLDLADIQNIVLRGYTMYSIRHFVFAIRDVAGTRRFLQALLPGSGSPVTITTAETQEDKPQYGLTLSFTSTGLQQLLPANEYKQVSNKTPQLFPTFHRGAADPGTAARVGDIGDSAPDHWWSRSGGWQLQGAPPTDPTAIGALMHLVITLHDGDAAVRETHTADLMAMIASASTAGIPALELVFRQDSDPLAVGHENMIHFGYADGFTQPRVDGVPWDPPVSPDPDDRPRVPAFNFVITPKPSVPVPSAEEGPPGQNYTAHSFLYNGTFAAFRVLAQDIAAFEAFINQADDPELLAAKMCGRWRDGTPVEVSNREPMKTPLHGLELTNFQYASRSPNQLGPYDGDALGQHCPYGSHIRRTNPRDDIAVTGNESTPSYPKGFAARHRVMRRATAYGPPYDPANPNDGNPRGLIGLFMGVSLPAQFEFIMQLWVFAGNFRNPDASTNGSGVDPLFGPSSSAAYNSKVFEYNTAETGAPAYVSVPPTGQGPELTRFVRTDGGLYVFLPSITAIGLLVRGAIQ